MSKADEIITALVRLIPNLHIALLNTQHSPQAAMVQWLTSSPDAWPGDLALGRYVELKSADEMKSLVKFDRHHLEDEQMKLHIGQGKLPTQLALEWAGRVSFVLTEGLVFKKIAFMDDVIEGQGDDEGGFDADAAIATGELDKVITGMIDALGGVMN
jgi:recombination associated protein RdgC